MTRDQQIEICRKCNFRKMDMMQGLLCGKTEAKATFEEECPEFEQDPDMIADPKEDKEFALPNKIEDELDPELMEVLKSKQRFIPGMLLGLVAGFIGAIIWVAIAVATGYNVGLIAVLIGAMVGFAIRKAGKGVETKFGIMGAIIAFLSVLMGNIIIYLSIAAVQFDLDLITLIGNLNFSNATELVIGSTSVIDFLFYGIAIWEGYKFSFRKLSAQDISNLKENREAIIERHSMI